MALSDIGPMIPVTVDTGVTYRAMYNNTAAELSVDVTVQPKGVAAISDTILLQPYQQIAFTFKLDGNPSAGLWCYPI